MPQRDDELPEGTDHIINGAMETGGGDNAGGFIGSAGADGTGGTAIGAGAPAATQTRGGTNVTNSNDNIGATSQVGGQGAAGVIDQIRDQASALRDQAGGRVREFAESGKGRASEALDDLSRVVAETAETIDERMGDEYGEYARRAADAVSGFAETLRGKDVDELYDNVRTAVRKSPAIAIGIAAVVGFTLVRLIKSGLDEAEASRGSGSKTGA